MTTPEAAGVAMARIGIIKSLALLGLGLVAMAHSTGTNVRDVVDSMRSPELNRAERDGHAAGYYEGLIGGRDGIDLSRSDSSQRLIGNPSGWVPSGRPTSSTISTAISSVRAQANGSNERCSASHLSPMHFGMHDDPVTLEKPAGTFRIAVLGSSIDMGWGVKHQDTYINQLESWLNSHSARLGLVSPRRFEVLNFGVAGLQPACSVSRRFATRSCRSSPTW